jgi:hypothetical protein
MKNTFKLFSVIAITAVIIFSMSACATSGGSGPAKTLVITGIEGFSGDVLVDISSNARNLTGSMVAVGGAAISGNNLTVPLVTPKNESNRWAGKGEYYIVLVFNQGGKNVIYFYSQGGMTALKYNISETTTTIAFNQFRKL